MEFSWRTVMLLLGILTVVVIIFDGFRRMRRNREESLRLDIRQDFKFPSAEERSEFPSGGFRVVDEEAGSPSVQRKPSVAPVSKAKSASADQVQASSKPVNGTEQESADLPDYRNEPFFSNDFSASGGSLLDPEIGASLSSKPEAKKSALKAADQAVRKTVSAKPQSSSRSVASKAAKPAVTGTSEGQTAVEPTTSPRRRKVVKPRDARKANAASQAGQTDKAMLAKKAAAAKIKAGAAAARQKALEEKLAAEQSDTRSVDLEKTVPVLMNVDVLGKEETSLAMQALRPDSEAATKKEESPTLSDEVEAAIDDTSMDGLDETGSREEPTLTLTEDSLEDFEPEDADPHLEDEVDDEIANERSNLVIYANDDAENLAERDPAKVALVIRVLSRDPKGFHGSMLLRLFEDCDLRYGSEGIFHRFEEADGLGPIQFSIAQAVEPGIFTPDKMEEQHFEGLTFFMGLPGARRPMEAFRAMSELAKVLSRNLDAVLRDEKDSVLSDQTLEHYRSQVLEYERQQYLAKRVAADRR